MKSILLLLCAVLMALFPPIMAAFCFLPQPRFVCGEYFASQLVVEATLAKTQTILEGSDPDDILAHVYSLRVEKVFRGKNTDQIRVYEGNDSGRAPFSWLNGTSYLLFLFYSPQDGAWALDGCGNSAPLEKAGRSLEEIHAIQIAHDGGKILGNVSRQGTSIPLAGVKVTAHGNKGTFQGKTDAKGAFQLEVPDGTYSVDAVSPGLSFEKYDISYDDPGKVRIEPGGCAQIQFVQKE